VTHLARQLGRSRQNPPGRSAELITDPPSLQGEPFYTDVEMHSAHDYECRAPFQSPPTPVPRPCVQTHGGVRFGLITEPFDANGGVRFGLITEPFDANGRKMNSWYAKLPDWQMGLTWLVVTGIAGVIYFVPLVNLLARFAD